MTETRARAIGYVRVSTLRQGQNDFRLGAQRDSIESYCAAACYELLTVIPDVMSSGRTDKLHGRAAAVAAIQAGITDVLIVKALDRATRDVVDGAQLVRLAHDEGWRLLSLDGVDSSDPDQEFLNNMRVAFTQEERRKISERTKAGLARARRQGKRIGRPSTIDHAVVQRIRDMQCSDGLSAKMIVATLTDEGVPTPGGSDRWHDSTVRGILAREQVA